jgi:hypothetical protein
MRAGCVTIGPSVAVEAADAGAPACTAEAVAPVTLAGDAAACRSGSPTAGWCAGPACGGIHSSTNAVAEAATPAQAAVTCNKRVRPDWRCTVGSGSFSASKMERWKSCAGGTMPSNEGRVRPDGAMVIKAVDQ